MNRRELFKILGVIGVTPISKLLPAPQKVYSFEDVNSTVESTNWTNYVDIDVTVTQPPLDDAYWKLRAEEIYVTLVTEWTRVYGCAPPKDSCDDQMLEITGIEVMLRERGIIDMLRETKKFNEPDWATLIKDHYRHENNAPSKS